MMDLQRSQQQQSSSSLSPSGQEAVHQASSSQAGSQQADPINFAFLKGPKRKRLAKVGVCYSTFLLCCDVHHVDNKGMRCLP